ncbi:MAG: tandem-95 repeat protein [Pirellulales bacterium]|nr:tandem-95 repeat protein [Pirellulales bacterium]
MKRYGMVLGLLGVLLSAGFSDGAPCTLSNVPAYDWYHGCGPTAAASIIGYYDVHGCDDLFTASGWSNVKLTANVQDQISSPAHNAKYDPTPDDTSLPVPTKTSIADWFRTSVDPLGYGGSYQSYSDNALEDYAKYRGYSTANSWYESYGNFTWTDLVDQIDAGRPMMFLVDSSGDGGTDHFVPVLGYDDRGADGLFYGFYTTWSESETIRWERFRGMSSSYTWGVAYGTYFTIPFSPSNNPPVAVADAYIGSEDATFTIAAAGVLANDTDADSDPLTALGVTNPLHGTLSLNSNGGFIYTPDANYYGTDSFTYKANDGIDDSNTVAVTLTVTSVNDLPVAVNDSYSIGEDGVLNTYAYNGVLCNDTDADNTDFDTAHNDTLTMIVQSAPAHGQITLGSSGWFTYTPDANYYGTDSFTYKANDGTGDSNTATVNLDVISINDVPVALDDSYSVDENDVLHTYAYNGVLANDTDADNTDFDTTHDDTLTVEKQSDPAHGTLTLAATGWFTYTPDAGFDGTDSFTYKVFDGTAYSNLSTVLIEVLAALDIPGDATGDGLVDQADSIRLASNWGKSNANWSMGDFDGDGIVGPRDAALLASNWGYGTGSESVAVPEPGSLALLAALAMLGLLFRQRAG